MDAGHIALSAILVDAGLLLIRQPLAYCPVCYCDGDGQRLEGSCSRQQALLLGLEGLSRVSSKRIVAAHPIYKGLLSMTARTLVMQRLQPLA